MNRDRRFFAGLVGVAAIVTWLIWTGITDTMVYYLTPTELLERMEEGEEQSERMKRGVKVSGDVLPGSLVAHTDELKHQFVVVDPDNPDVQLIVHFRHPLPDTFTDEAEVVMEGRYLGDGVFEATEVLTKCGSRYEALPEDMDDRDAGYGAEDPYAGYSSGDSYAGYGEVYPDAEYGAGDLYVETTGQDAYARNGGI